MALRVTCKPTKWNRTRSRAEGFHLGAQTWPYTRENRSHEWAKVTCQARPKAGPGSRSRVGALTPGAFGALRGTCFSQHLLRRRSVRGPVTWSGPFPRSSNKLVWATGALVNLGQWWPTYGTCAAASWFFFFIIKSLRRFAITDPGGHWMEGGKWIQTDKKKLEENASKC